MTRVLVVDDEPALLSVLTHLLMDEGYRVQGETTSRLAVELMEREPPDLLITDVMMPGLDGWTVLDRGRARVPGLPAIVMSAIDPRKTPQAVGLDADHTVFLRKPFDIETLLASVARLTGT